MKSPLPEADLNRALGSLKDFQRRTVDYVFRRLYLDDRPANRMLISDEVGLGKTMVAKGVMARAFRHLWDRVPTIDVVYICSNADIARQNINRLEFLRSAEGTTRTATRLTLLARQMASLGEINFIALTPGTSFDLGTNLGVAGERALLYWLLRGAWEFGDESAPRNLLRGYAGRRGFRNLVRDKQPSDDEMKSIAPRFTAVLQKKPELRAEFGALCEAFGPDAPSISDEVNRRRNKLIGAIRGVLARTCVEALNPDLVILDEFQRFKHLMQGDDDASVLARSLFDYEDAHGRAKVLLLSATPYKMLTLSSQADEEDHYEDFIATLKFLEQDPERFGEMERAVTEFRLALLRLRSGGNIEALLQAKQILEGRLHRVMVRTERLSATRDGKGMLQERPVSMRLAASDARGYVGAQGVAKALGENDVMEYWKSAPYVLNFLDGYKLRDKFKLAADDPETRAAVAASLGSAKGHLLLPDSVRKLLDVPLVNPRFRAIVEETVDSGAWRLLWLPPGLAYYQLGGPFADPALRNFTKQLVFSAWRMVPRSVATLLSHAADVRIIEAFERSRGRTSAAASRWPTGLLRFQRDANKRLTGMPLFLLIYPSLALAELDPLKAGNGKAPEMEEVLRQYEAHFSARLQALPVATEPTAQPDERWYWAAPLLLDRGLAPNAMTTWLAQRNLPAIWTVDSRPGDDEGDMNWPDHVSSLQSMAGGTEALGTPPADLARVLAEASLASPAVSAYRALARQLTDASDEHRVGIRNTAARIGWLFRNLFNLPEAIALIRGMSSTEPYWRGVLQYCCQGGLQSVLDEYCHMVCELSGLGDKPPQTLLAGVLGAFESSLGIRPAAIGVDDIRIDGDGDSYQITTARLRCRYAMPFADARPEDTGTAAGPEAEVTRAEKVRDAFNSPFWPFVLVSTSIGQEGLDFHPYCHSVMHWNLPSNPVDLEQREGRVHRFKGHAVRKNVASAFGARAINQSGPDPWHTAFELARDERAKEENDMVPYWVYPIEGGAQIERRVPALPLSREVLRMADLRRTLAVYRTVFGQPRQEDLLEFLMARFSGPELERVCAQLRVDLSPPSERE